jgi:hypothetical protein
MPSDRHVDRGAGRAMSAEFGGGVVSGVIARVLGGLASGRGGLAATAVGWASHCASAVCVGSVGVAASATRSLNARTESGRRL